MRISDRKFETALHGGLLVIIFVLLFLNFRSNLVISSDLSGKRIAGTVKFNSAALSISRTIQKEGITRLSESQRREFLETHELSQVILADPSQLTEIPSDIEGERETRTLIRGNSDRYWYLHPVQTADGAMLLVLAMDIPDMAFLEDASRTLISVNIIAVIAIMVLYLLLFRFILSPFRKIKMQALEAGRRVDRGGDEVEEVVQEYQNIIIELQEKESQLIELNRTIQERAESLEHINDYLLESMSSGLVMVDRNGQVLSINKAAGEILNIKPDEFAGQTHDRIPGFTPEVGASVSSILADQTSRTYFEIDIRGAADRKVTVGINISTIHDDNSRIVGASMLLNDLTEIRTLHLESEARERLAALGEMAGGLAHQLRNSIGAINGYSQLLKRRMLRTNLDIEPITALEEETKEAEHLVDRFMHFARPFDFTPEPTNLGDLVNDVLETIKVRGDFEHIEFVITSKTFSPITAEIDGLLIKQALSNLIENAVNAYQGGPGRVEVRVAPETNVVRIDIRDYGCGIPPENMPRIFTPFFSSRPSGTGLGLPLTKKIIDLHHGRLTVDSTPGEGTTFTVLLPIEQTGSLYSAQHSAPERA